MEQNVLRAKAWSMNPSNALAPGTSQIAVPARWSSLSVSRQDPCDYACSLHVIVTVTRRLGLGAAVDAREILNALALHKTRSEVLRIESLLREGPGLFERDICSLAAAAGLGARRSNQHDVAQFQEQAPGVLWIARVWARFSDPNGVHPDEPYGHYVAVIDHLADDGVLVVADPHPWNPPVYCVGLDSFEAAWRAPKWKRPWAARLFRGRY
jgi:hypothetical protein